LLRRAADILAIGANAVIVADKGVAIERACRFEGVLAKLVAVIGVQRLSPVLHRLSPIFFEETTKLFQLGAARLSDIEFLERHGIQGITARANGAIVVVDHEGRALSGCVLAGCASRTAGAGQRVEAAIAETK